MLLDHLLHGIHHLIWRLVDLSKIDIGLYRRPSAGTSWDVGMQLMRMAEQMWLKRTVKERVHTVPEVALIGGVIEPIPGALHSTAVE